MYRRLHVIIGDANLSETAIWLKHGMTAIVIAMIEAGAVPEDLALENPDGALHEISHDPSLMTTVRLADGRQMTAVDLQREYLDRKSVVQGKREGVRGQGSRG